MSMSNIAGPTEGASTFNNESPEGAKFAYRPPTLTSYGSVKDLTHDAGSANGDAGQGMMPSDPALKENVVRIGTHPAGFGIYLFDYRPEYRDSCGHGRQFGVMADEVEPVIPEAVSRGANGFRVVDYAQIGITRH